MLCTLASAYTLALHGSLNDTTAALPRHGSCVAPGRCTPPSTKYSRVAHGPVPGQQWNTAGGFCGAFSTQHAALSAGAWISQDLVRKANREQPGRHFMHGDRKLGFEVMPSNVEATVDGLRLSYEMWDYTQPKPQAAAFKKWLKSQLVRGHPVVWFPMCKGDPHRCYPESCPNGGRVDHVEPMFGIFSNHPLEDPLVYDDDWVLHASDQDYQPYYRTLNSLNDTSEMNGNCAHAGRGFGKNEMYPCFDSSVTYGLAVTGLAINMTGVATAVSVPMPKVAITTTGAVSEPNVRVGAKPMPITAQVKVSGLIAGEEYSVYRYDSTAALPMAPPLDVGYAHKFKFSATGDTYDFDDPTPFASDSAVYYVAVPSAGSSMVSNTFNSSNTTSSKSIASTRLAPLSIDTPIPSVPVAAGVNLPLVSLGTGSGQHADATAATKLWLDIGGRAIDTAHVYFDEGAIAKGIAQSGVARSELFITTKVGCGTHRHISAQIDDNLRQLQMDHVELTLVHFDKCWGVGSISETWRALEDAKAAGKTKAIGVSNFNVDDLIRLQRTARTWPPALNQCSMSVGYHDDETIAFCDQHAITYMAYSPLCGGANGSSCKHGSVISLPTVQAIAQAHGVSAAQVALKWIVQQGRPVATAVATEDHGREDLDLWQWGNLTAEEMKALREI